jgi:hypothetical protein
LENIFAKCEKQIYLENGLQTEGLFHVNLFNGWLKMLKTGEKDFTRREKK